MNFLGSLEKFPMGKFVCKMCKMVCILITLHYWQHYFWIKMLCMPDCPFFSGLSGKSQAASVWSCSWPIQAHLVEALRHLLPLFVKFWKAFRVFCRITEEFFVWFAGVDCWAKGSEKINLFLTFFHTVENVWARCFTTSLGGLVPTTFWYSLVKWFCNPMKLKLLGNCFTTVL